MFKSYLVSFMIRLEAQLGVCGADLFLLPFPISDGGRALEFRLHIPSDEDVDIVTGSILSTGSNQDRVRVEPPRLRRQVRMNICRAPVERGNPRLKPLRNDHGLAGSVNKW